MDYRIFKFNTCTYVVFVYAYTQHTDSWLRKKFIASSKGFSYTVNLTKKNPGLVKSLEHSRNSSSTEYNSHPLND